MSDVKNFVKNSVPLSLNYLIITSETCCNSCTVHGRLVFTRMCIYVPS
jgi:hypothetical protein